MAWLNVEVAGEDLGSIQIPEEVLAAVNEKKHDKFFTYHQDTVSIDLAGRLNIYLCPQDD